MQGWLGRAGREWIVLLTLHIFTAMDIAGCFWRASKATSRSGTCKSVSHQMSERDPARCGAAAARRKQHGEGNNCEQVRWLGGCLAPGNVAQEKNVIRRPFCPEVGLSACQLASEAWVHPGLSLKCWTETEPIFQARHMGTSPRKKGFCWYFNSLYLN